MIKTYSSKGGQRQGSGRKYKYEEYGQKKPMRTEKVPEDITTREHEQLIKDFLIEKYKKIS